MALDENDRVAEEQMDSDESDASEQDTGDTYDCYEPYDDLEVDLEIAHTYSSYGNRTPLGFRNREIVPQSDTELRALEAWRTEVLSIVNQRIAQFVTRSSTCAQLRWRNRTRILAAPAAAGSSSRALGIGEIVERVLRFADPDVHLVAWSVNHLWQKSAAWAMGEHGIAKKYYASQRVRPVSFAEHIHESDGIPNTRLTIDELEELDRFTEKLYGDVVRRVQDPAYKRSVPDRTLGEAGRPPLGDAVYYLPARLTQALNLPAALSRRIRVLLQDQYWHRWNLSDLQLLEVKYSNTLHSSRWLDFSQFEMNPYLDALFPDRFAIVDGAGELSFRPSWSDQCHVINRHHIPLNALAHIENQFITYPPVTTVNVGIWLPETVSEDRRDLMSLCECHNARGVRIGALIHGLEVSTTLAKGYWAFWAQQLGQAASRGHWTQDIWHISGVPKLVLTLEGDRILEEYDEEILNHHWAQTNRVVPRSTREAEWIPPNLTSSFQTTTSLADTKGDITITSENLPRTTSPYLQRTLTCESRGRGKATY
jgi:hypothetical protein